MAAKILTDREVDLRPLLDKTCAVIGFGAQGRAHALNLRDSGVAVVVGLPSKSRSRSATRRAGLRLTNTANAVRRADVIVFAVPDTKMGEIFREEIAPALRSRQLLLFVHGFAIHYRQVIPPDDVDVVLVAPKGLGKMVRTQFVEGKGVPCVFAIQQDATGRARALALAYAKAIGGGRAGIIETTFAEETEADMFAEQAVLCGGMSALVEAGFETLVKAGYQPEMAYFECLHELKFIVDLVHRAGIAGMRERISETAKWGDVSDWSEDHRQERAQTDGSCFAQNSEPELRQRMAARDRHRPEALSATARARKKSADRKSRRAPARSNALARGEAIVACCLSVPNPEIHLHSAALIR